MFVYNAETWCDECGLRLRRDLAATLSPADLSNAEFLDTDEYPQPATEEPTDYVDHCAAGEDCLEAVDLLDYGLPTVAFAPLLVGAETRKVGAILSDGLTDHGVEYTKELLGEAEPTPYQQALHALWSETFADQL